MSSMQLFSGNYYAGRLCSRIMLPLFLSLLSTSVQAKADGWDVDGQHSELHVTGMLTEAACRLDMTSSFQQVEMGYTATADLAKPGDEAQPVPFQVRLLDCLRTQSSQHDNRTGTLTWSSNQPVISVAFVAPVDVDMPSLIKVAGDEISGVGLKLMDDHYQTINMGVWNRPQFLDPGQDELTFYVAPVRTHAPLVAGEYQAIANFSLNYE
ncbi:fimbrial protein [Klebsiella aerogenes]